MKYVPEYGDLVRLTIEDDTDKDFGKALEGHISKVEDDANGWLLVQLHQWPAQTFVVQRGDGGTAYGISLVTPSVPPEPVDPEAVAKVILFRFWTLVPQNTPIGHIREASMFAATDALDVIQRR